MLPGKRIPCLIRETGLAEELGKSLEFMLGCEGFWSQRDGAPFLFLRNSLGMSEGVWGACEAVCTGKFFIYIFVRLVLLNG